MNDVLIKNMSENMVSKEIHNKVVNQNNANITKVSKLKEQLDAVNKQFSACNDETCDLHHFRTHVQFSDVLVGLVQSHYTIQT